MKFLTSCMQWHEKPDEIDGWSGLYKLSFLRTLINFGFYVTVKLQCIPLLFFSCKGGRGKEMGKWGNNFRYIPSSANYSFKSSICPSFFFSKTLPYCQESFVMTYLGMFRVVICSFKQYRLALPTVLSILVIFTYFSHIIIFS